MTDRISEDSTDILSDVVFNAQPWHEMPIAVATAKFSYDQLTKLCHCAIRNDACIIAELTKIHSLSESQIDILLSSEHAFDIETVAWWVENLSPRQLDFCLRHESPAVRRNALVHCRCTKAQEVAHHLMWGDL